MWRQFLRLKAAAQLADGGGKAILEAARADLAAGRAVQVAGYTVNPALAQGLQVATLTPPVAKPAGRAVWLEVSSQPDPTLAPATKAALPGWEAAGWSVEAQAVHGPPFWQTAEIEDAPTLVAATRDALTRETSASAVPSTAILVGANP